MLQPFSGSGHSIPVVATSPTCPVSQQSSATCAFTTLRRVLLDWSDGRFGPGAALVVVDIQNDFADPDGSLAVADAAAVVGVANAEIAAALAAGAKVAYTADWHPPDTPHFVAHGGVWPPHCVRGTWGAAFHPDLQIRGEVVRKATGPEDGYSGFTVRHPDGGGRPPHPARARCCRPPASRDIVIVGLATDYCVLATALDGVDLGSGVTVLADGRPRRGAASPATATAPSTPWPPPASRSGDAGRRAARPVRRPLRADDGRRLPRRGLRRHRHVRPVRPLPARRARVPGGVRRRHRPRAARTLHLRTRRGRLPGAPWACSPTTSSNVWPRFRFTGEVRAMAEGDLAFAGEPLLSVTGPIVEVQLLETLLINTVGVETMLASKAARVAQACAGRAFVDFSARRDHGRDAALAAARASAVAGAAATSLVEAGPALRPGPVGHDGALLRDGPRRRGARLPGLPPPVRRRRRCCWSTPTTSRRAPGGRWRRWPPRAWRRKGIRLDSGDLAAMARRGPGHPRRRRVPGACRSSCRATSTRTASPPCWPPAPRSTPSAWAPAWAPAPTARTSSMVYKLVEQAGKPRMKLSEGKATLPGPQAGVAREGVDVIALADEAGPGDGARPLLAVVMRDGRRPGRAGRSLADRLAAARRAVRGVAGGVAGPAADGDAERRPAGAGGRHRRPGGWLTLPRRAPGTGAGRRSQ